jgi:site-specific DNA-methyltransferase (adenine-specific)
MINKIDIIELINKSNIKDESIDCILADPPYNIGKNFGDESDMRSMNEYSEWVKKWLPDLQRVLTPSGTGFIYGFDENLAHISVNLTLPHRWLTWYYTNKNTSKGNFWQRSHESIIVFWKDKTKRIFNSDSVREPYTELFLKNAAGKVRKGTTGRLSRNGLETIYKAHDLGAKGRDVIKIPALAGGSGSHERIFFCKTCNDVFMGNKKKHIKHNLIEHPTQKPQALAKKLLKSCLPYSSAHECFYGNVLIPFSGSGSECLCCKTMGVKFIAGDTNPEYVKYANMLLDKYGNS